METLVLTIDLAALLTLLFFSVRNERRPPGTGEVGPFAIRQEAAAAREAEPSRNRATPTRLRAETYRRPKALR